MSEDAGTGRRGLVGRIARRLRRGAAYVVTHQVPAGGDPAPPREPFRPRPTVAIVACHRISGGHGDDVRLLVERALDRRGHVVGPLSLLHPHAPVVIVRSSGSRTRTCASLPPALAGRRIGIVTYGRDPARRGDTLDELRRALGEAGARPLALSAVFDTTHRRPGNGDPPDDFGAQTLGLLLDDLLATAGEHGAAGSDGPRPPATRRCDRDHE